MDSRAGPRASAMHTTRGLEVADHTPTPRAFGATNFAEEKRLIVERASQLESAISVSWNEYHAIATDFDLLQEFGFQFCCASDELLGDHPTVLGAVSANGELLAFASSAMRDDFEVVMRAVQRSPWALQHASERLRSNKDIVLAAVERDGAAIRFALDGLDSDRALVLEACRCSGFDGLSSAATWSTQQQEALAQDFELQAVLLEARLYCRPPRERKGGISLYSREKQGGVRIRQDLQSFEDLLAKWFRPTCKDHLLIMARRAPHQRSLEQYYSTAAADLKQDVPWQTLLGAASSRIADRGHNAPVLAVSARAAGPHVYGCEVRMLSGACFNLDVCGDPILTSDVSSVGDASNSGNLPQASEVAEDRGPTVADLAARLVQELPQQTQVQGLEYVSILLAADNGDGEQADVPVTAWEWARPLADFALSA